MSSKFAKFAISNEEEELENKRQAYWELASAAPKPGPIDRATELWLRSVVMRSGWLRSKLRSGVIQAARIERGQYRCASCKDIFKANELEVDHQYSRVGFSGEEVSFTEFVNNTFCDPQYLAALCKPCHKWRTARERNKTKR